MMLRVAFASNDTLISRYAIQRLCREMPEGVELVLIVHETMPYPWQAKFRQFVKAALPNLIRGYATNPYWRLKFLERRAFAFERDALFGGAIPELPEAVPHLAVRRLHDEESIKELKEHNIDLLLVQGTLQILPSVFTVVRRVVGLHFGLLPDYRGLHGWIWAAARGDRAGIALCLHELTPKIGAGSVLMQYALENTVRLSLVTFRGLGIVALVDMTLAYLEKSDNTLSLTPPEELPPSCAPAPLWVRYLAARHLRRWAQS